VERRARVKLRYVAVLAVFVWAIYYYWHVQHRELVALSVKSSQLQAQLVAAQSEHAHLQSLADEFQNKVYIERYATQHFNLILPNQVAFTVQN
jgi:hypothetical protein